MAIPKDVQLLVHEEIVSFNKQNFPEGNIEYFAKMKGNYVYLNRNDFGNETKICRLKYSGNFEKWEFAIYSSFGFR